MGRTCIFKNGNGLQTEKPNAVQPYQIPGESREPLPMRAGDVMKVDSEYIRNGIVSIFCFVQPHTGTITQFVETIADCD